VHAGSGGLLQPSDYEDGDHEVERRTQRRNQVATPRWHDPGFV
jgi:hypothetical protein